MFDTPVLLVFFSLPFRLLCYLFPPEAVGDVLKRSVFQETIEPLIGGWLAERTQMADVGANLDEVEVALLYVGWNAQPSAVPCHLELRMLLMDVLCQQVQALRVCIASHEGDAGDVAPILADEIVNGIGVQRKSDVFPQIMTVTARAATWTIGYVDGQRHLVGYLLKNNACVYVLQHFGNFIMRERSVFWLPLPDGLVRSCSRASGSL